MVQGRASRKFMVKSSSDIKVRPSERKFWKFSFLAQKMTKFVGFCTKITKFVEICWIQTRELQNLWISNHWSRGPKFWKITIFTWNIDFVTSEDPKFSLGPALTRNVKINMACRDGIRYTTSNIVLCTGGASAPSMACDYLFFFGRFFGPCSWFTNSFSISPCSAPHFII